jgi:hypothetical protein
MELLQKNKSLIIGVIILGAAFFAYANFFKPEAGSTSADLSAEEIGSDVLALYASLQSVSLDQSLFSSPLYRNLQDFSTTLSSQPVGRTNPFDIIGRD